MEITPELAQECALFHARVLPMLRAGVSCVVVVNEKGGSLELRWVKSDLPNVELTCRDRCKYFAPRETRLRPGSC